MPDQARSGLRRRRSAASEPFAFQDVNMALLWARLALTAAQLARLTGLSRRQVEWWRRRGYLTPAPDATDRFSGDAVTLAMLMKQAVDAGVPLPRAYEMATHRLASTLTVGLSQLGANEAGEDRDRAALADLEQKLLATHNTIGLVLDVIQPLVKRDGR